MERDKPLKEQLADTFGTGKSGPRPHEHGPKCECAVCEMDRLADADERGEGWMKDPEPPAEEIPEAEYEIIEEAEADE